ncbi:MAG TPA: thioredoxin domain-containing protein [Candidatus Binatia bacterium]
MLAVMIMLTAGYTLGFANAVVAGEQTTASQTFVLESTRVLGLPSAPVTMFELSDFQCSFCRKFWAETLPRIKETYIKNGQVRFAYQHFALQGEHSFAAAQGAECAAEQKKFWPYHDKLFQSQGGLAFTNAKLKQYARQVGLDVGAFDQCLDSRKYQEKIEDETKRGFELGARGTPTFFLNGRILVGAQPFQVFQTAIEEALAKASTQKPRSSTEATPANRLPRSIQ